ncbi:MAG: hypothetical protein ACLFSU_01465 [Acholeplasmataceae bacterium]
MKDAIERYVYAVTRRLPEEIQEEVKEELRANIKDMLPEQPTDERIESVLKELGHPCDMAARYRSEDRYLISPRYFTDYLYTLKVVAIILILIGSVVGMLETVIGRASDSILESVGEVLMVILSSAFEGLLSAFVIVTVIFAIIEYVQREKRSDWRIKDLPEVPKESTLSISRTGTVFSVIFSVSFSVVFILILIEYHRLIGIYAEGEVVEPFFNPDALAIFVPLAIIGLILGLMADAFKLIDGRWTKRTTIAHTIKSILVLFIVVTFLTTSSLIRPEFQIELARLMEVTADEVARGFEIGFLVIIILASVATLIDLGPLWYRFFRYDRQPGSGLRAHDAKDRSDRMRDR